MNNKISLYLSKAAKNISPYQWEGSISDKSLRFDANTMPFSPPNMTLFINSLKQDCPINEYSDPSYLRLKKLIARYEGVRKENITVTNSGDEAIDILAKTFINPGDYFITTPPTYEMFSIQCGINNGKQLEIPLAEDNFEVDTGQIIKASIDPKVKLIFLVNPNNPTASIIPREIIEKILKSAQAIVVVDETYREFYGESSVSFLEGYENLVILRSFSKFAAMAGARVGYLVASPRLSQKFDVIRFPMGVSFFSYKLAEFVLESDQEWIKDQIEMIKKERERLYNKLKEIGFYVYPSQSNFLLVKIGNKASEICLKLKQRGIVIRDRSEKKYLSGCVRITIRSPKENNLLLKKFKEVLI